VSAWLPIAVIVPLLGGIGAFLLRGRGGALLGMTASALTAVVALLIAAEVFEAGPRHHPLGGWAAPLGIGLRADGLSALLLLTVAIVGVAISIHALAWWAPSTAGGGASDERWPPRQAFWCLWPLCLSGLAALFLSADVFNVYVGLEVVTLAAVALVVLSRGPGAIAAAMRYLLAAFLGSLLYLAGVALLYAAHDALDMALLAERIAPGSLTGIAMALMVGGLLVKTALFPAHFWLPRAHAEAPAPVSAILSALVVKASFYLVVRLWFDVFPAASTEALAQVVGILGAVAVIWGALLAIRQRRLKLLVAYSTVSQLGYLFLLFPLAAEPAGGAGSASAREAALQGGVYHGVSHAFAKAALFLSAGTVMQVMGSDRIGALRGLSSRLPLTMFVFAIAGLSLVGLPPTGGFVGKWLLLGAALEDGRWPWALVILVGGLLTAGYVFMVLSRSLAPCRPPPQTWPGGRRVRIQELAALTLALVALGLGLRAVEPLDLLAQRLMGGVP
jgi:multicomponent Na+:H+ antiporter subunit D